MEVRRQKLENPTQNMKTVLYLTKNFKEKTIEGKTLDEMNIDRMCCRRHFLTHVDIE
jgi:DNA-directed RNA polymerase I, II, and III subunit RPABC5